MLENKRFKRGTNTDFYFFLIRLLVKTYSRLSTYTEGCFIRTCGIRDKKTLYIHSNESKLDT